MNDSDARNEGEWAVELVDPRRDLDEIQAIDRESFFQPWTAAAFARELRKYPLSRIYVIRVAGAGVVGFCVTWMIVDELHVNSFAIARRWRRRGAGRALLARVLVMHNGLGLSGPRSRCARRTWQLDNSTRPWASSSLRRVRGTIRGRLRTR